MNLVGHAAEGVARQIGRRELLRRSAAAIFSFTVGAAVTVARPQSAGAATCDFVDDNCSCGPLNGRYCTSCRQAACPSNCSAHMGHCPAGPHYQCWCTKTCCYNCSNPNTSYCGYWKCCDCDCPLGVSCSCRAFTYTCTTAAGSLAPPCCP